MAEIVKFEKLSRFKTAESFRHHLQELQLNLPVDEKLLTEAEHSPLAQSIELYGKTAANRWCIQPMEGWDGLADGNPSDLTLRRWERFGASGAKLIFGGEACAVREDGRSSPSQVMAVEHTKDGLRRLYDRVHETHRHLYGTSDDLILGLQLTHSGRFSKPNRRDAFEPVIAYNHPILDKKFGFDPHDDSHIISDEGIDRLIECYITAAKMAYEIGFDFVDVKHCHGYLGHELLSAFTREGKYGGSFENRTRFLRTIVEQIRAAVPNLGIAVRISAFDLVPFKDDEATRTAKNKGVGVPEDFSHCLPYRYAFGVNQDNPLEYDLTETVQLMKLFEKLNIPLVNVSCGSPYYNPHIQRPASFPPSDGYRPPEDPLVGVNRQIQMVRALKEYFPNLVLIGTGYSYLQEFLPLVAQGVIRDGWADFIGYGRGVLSYPTMPADTLLTGEMDTKHICRTFSDCTTAPRHGMVSGCYPLDEYYKNMKEARKLKEVKKG
ncbi:NADH:flavin oxidoreductase [bacterium]|nr:NADH:flavin oxidoreductase [bacterium]